ncbi:hypothetical protein FGO68_gene11174 [Halteria grandinella]|uniref:Lysine-specific metallo-endopeptidase domain-containing protein n=1 Tax=Halteria grandinella TaxID=5974 RepID=A0A8J8NGU3_HALGN|nr:hypothetical protein FGO68_gene11174 [Halteria grandinella]
MREISKKKLPKQSTNSSYQQQLMLDQASRRALEMLTQLYEMKIYQNREDIIPAVHPQFGGYFNLDQSKLETLTQSLKKGFSFKINNLSLDQGVSAFVMPRDISKIIYVSDHFFKQDTKLSNNCHIGIIIHEASHFKDVFGKRIWLSSYKMKAEKI